MIDYLENNETQLKFVTYPLARFIVYIVPTIILIFSLYWTFYYSPIESSLICDRTVSSQIDCILKEKSILNPFLTRTEIKDLKKAQKLTVSQGQITLEANYDPSFFNLLKNPELYSFPSTSNTLIEFSNIDFSDPFKVYNQVDAINEFIHGKTKQQSLTVKQSFSLLTFTIFIVPWIAIHLIISSKIVKWFINTSLKTNFECDRNSKILTIVENKIFRRQITQTYPLDQIKQIKFNKNVLDNNVSNADLLIQFNNDREYLIDEYLNGSSAQQHCQLINKFIQQSKET